MDFTEKGVMNPMALSMKGCVCYGMSHIVNPFEPVRYDDDAHRRVVWMKRNHFSSSIISVNTGSIIERKDRKRVSNGKTRM